MPIDGIGDGLLSQRDTEVAGLFMLTNFCLSLCVNACNSFRVNIVVHIPRHVKNGLAPFLSRSGIPAQIIRTALKHIANFVNAFNTAFIRRIHVGHLFQHNQLLFLGLNIDASLVPVLGYTQPSVLNTSYPVPGLRANDFCAKAEGQSPGHVSLIGHRVEIIYPVAHSIVRIVYLP